MERFGVFMVVAGTVPRLIHKLQVLLTYEGVAYKRSNVPVKEAMAKLELISRRITDAEKHQITSDLADSFGMELKILSNFEDIVDIFIVRIELRRQNILNKIIPSHMCFKYFWDMSSLSNEIERLIAHVVGLRQHAPLGPTGTTSSHPQPRNEDYLDPDDSDLGVLNDKADELLKQLVKPKRGELDTVIAVTGVAGSGKTVLAKRVSTMKIAKLRFHCHAWVNVSGDFEASDLFVNILKQLSLERLDENLQDNELQLRLEHFSKENHCLIVVDDVRTPNDLDNLEVILKCIGGQSRLILTTRNQDVAHAASEQRDPIWLRSLTKEESWKLFLKKARMAEDSFNSSESINLQKDILRKCDGSPRAILTLGGLLSNRDLSDWRCVIEQLSSMDLRELSTKMPEVQWLSTKDKRELSSVIHPAAQENILALSYQDLSSQVRYCFLYFGLFPRAFEIPIRRLFHLWLAEGLVIPLADEHMAPEDLAKEYVKQLICRNLIEVVKVRFDGSPKTCFMPGNLWDVIHPEALSLRLFHVHKNTAYTSARSPEFNIQRLVEYVGIGNYPSLDPDLQYLRSYLCFNTRPRDSPNQEIGMFLNNVVARRGFGLLTVLDLEHVYKPVLPEKIGKLVHLKYLGLRWTFLDSIPLSVGDLPYLEVLDVKHTNITFLPSSILKAKSLKHLYLSDFDMFSRSLNSGSLTNLQSLSGLLIGNTSLVNNYLNKSPGLKKLKLTCSSRLVGALADNISQLSDLQFLRLRSIDEFDQLSPLELGPIADHQKLSNLYLLGKLPRHHSFPPNLKILTLSASELEHDPMPMLGQLRQLNTLRLLGRSYAGQQMTCLYEGFPELRILKLCKLENLEEWIVEEGAMPLLRELEIRLCNRLQQLEGLQLITTLRKVILTNMPVDVVANVKRVMVNASVQASELPIDP